jgi:uncharacterized membrane protein YidH (DUF202 family)
VTEEPRPAALYDAGLQPERTALAWRRTGLALSAGSLIAVRVLATSLGHSRTLDALLGRVSGPAKLPSGRLPLAVTVVSVAGGLAALGVVLASR